MDNSRDRGYRPGDWQLHSSEGSLAFYSSVFFALYKFFETASARDRLIFSLALERIIMLTIDWLFLPTSCRGSPTRLLFFASTCVIDES